MQLNITLCGSKVKVIWMHATEQEIQTGILFHASVSLSGDMQKENEGD